MCSVIGKVLRGRNVARLLYYLYGPGKAHEHSDPHLVAGFSDPAELEPERRPDGSRDFRRLAGLLTQPLAALAGPGYPRPVWHCSVRAAPEDRMLSDAEWAQVAAGVMDRTGLAPAGDDLGVRWVAVRHGADHVHIVATLARQDGTRPKIWNDFYRVREACQDAEAWFGLRSTAPADRTAARRPSRSEAEQSARRRWAEPPRVTLRREVCTAAAGASTEQEFFARLADAGVAVRQRYSTIQPGEVTGYAIGLPGHTARDGGVVWYGGGKLAADLTLPKLRRRWAGSGTEPGTFPGQELPTAAARAALRKAVTEAAEHAPDEAGFFTQLREAGVMVRLRFSDTCPGQVTGYAVGLSGHNGSGGAPLWYGGGRLAAGLTLPRLRRRWEQAWVMSEGRSGAFRCTVPEQNAIFEHAARQARAAAEHIRRSARSDPRAAADAAWAAADALHVAARALGSPELRRAADRYDRAARTPYGRIPRATREGSQMRAAARLMALVGQITGETTLVTAALIANLVALAVAVGQLREAQQHAAQAAAARDAASQLHAVYVRSRSPGSRRTLAEHRQRNRPQTAADAARGDFPVAPQPGRPGPAARGRTRPRPGRGPLPLGRAGPGR
jgi:hypothetical protein